MQRFVFVVLAALAALPCFAGTKQIQAKAWPVATHVSEAGEDKTAFLRRVAVAAQAWTAETGFETCGMVATDGQRWGLRLITLRSQVDCVFAPGVAPEGMHTTSETFHTHPRASVSGYLKLTAETRTSLKSLGERSPPSGVQVENDNEFSARDYAAGPGYLVTNGRLLFQGGRGQREDLGAVPAP